MNVRTLLEAQGLAPQDITAAVKQSRQVVKDVSSTAGFLAHVLEVAAEKQKMGSRKQMVAMVLAGVASKIESNANAMLGKKR